MRFITLTDGLGMADSLYIFNTNAPKLVLENLEKYSNFVASNTDCYEDIPIWCEELESKGYIFDYVDEHRHITPYGDSTTWLAENYGYINEHYTIEY